MSHIWMSHLAHMNESCRTYEWVMSYVTRTNESRLTHVNASWMSEEGLKPKGNAHASYEWVMSHMCACVMYGSCLTYQWVMSHIWMSHVTHINGSCHTYEWIMSHMCACVMNGSCLTRVKFSWMNSIWHTWKCLSHTHECVMASVGPVACVHVYVCVCV